MQQSLFQKQFIIVYDKLTKPIAISLRNSLKKDYSCALWSKKEYISNECRLTNRNFLILLNEDIVKENLANPNLKSQKYIDGMDMVVEGNTVGFKFNPETSPRKLKEVWKNVRKCYFKDKDAPSIVVIISLIAILGARWALYSAENKMKFQLFFEAIDKFKRESLEKFLNGELL